MIRATSQEVATILGELTSLVASGGGYLNPMAVLVEDGGQMHVEYAGDASVDAGPLAALPWDLLVPIDDVAWSAAVDRLEVTSYGPDVIGIRRDLLDLLVALFNATGKLPWYAQWHPRGALAETDPLVAAIRRVRPHFTPERGAAGYLRARLFRLPDRARVEGPAEDDHATGGLRPSVLMPILDLVNHHPDSAPFAVAPGRLSIAISRGPGTRECFVRYRARADALSLALQYGFVAPDVRFAFSAPVSVPVEGVGDVEIAAVTPAFVGDATFPVTARTANGLRLSHLIFDAGHPERSSAAVALPVRALAMQRGMTDAKARTIADDAYAQIVAANLDLLDRLVGEAASTAGAVAVTVGTAARIQANAIHSC